VAATFDSALLADLLGLIAHDLRNPLSALQSNVSFVSSILGAEDEDAREAMTDALISCEGLLRIIDNVELLSMELGGTREFERLPVGLGALVDEVAARCQSMARSHGVELTVAPRDARASDSVSAHREMLGRALSNLIQNAIQHAPPGTVVRVSLRSEPERCVAVVEDDGPALANELRQTVFTAPGQVASKGSSHGRYGRGIGLFGASLAAARAGASVQSVPRAGAPGNAFELSAARA
jgi:signal transduction histidine kinase